MWKYKLKLLLKYLTLETLNKIDYGTNFLINQKIKKFLNDISNDTPVIIYSSGVGDVIRKVLIYNNMYKLNIYVIANEINLITKKINKDVITPYKKNLRNVDYDNIILFGDNDKDLNVVYKAIKIKIVDDLLYHQE